uniref:Transcription factor CBF/NF-Y/archaeal histone domain-containing protein n=1 Tax=Chloropicon laureae TaxID=464258 RepID=A0A7S3E1Z7_9CHLO|mmetsp:Transcript_14441/g.37210  ORF Transcript_14441/g.37210 Transcript_14441/m.37210 type:complete len:193 (+) Transcript_14441:127-705(+)
MTDAMMEVTATAEAKPAEAAATPVKAAGPSSGDAATPSQAQAPSQTPGTSGKRERRDPIGLPRTRVQQVAAEVTTTSPNADVLFAITRATELFLEDVVGRLAGKPHLQQEGDLTVAYDDLAEVVQSQERLAFLHDIVPKRCALDVAFPPSVDAEGEEETEEEESGGAEASSDQPMQDAEDDSGGAAPTKEEA